MARRLGGAALGSPSDDEELACRTCARSARTGERAQQSTATLLGQLAFLVAVELGFPVLGSYIGRELFGD